MHIFIILTLRTLRVRTIKPLSLLLLHSFQLLVYGQLSESSLLNTKEWLAIMAQKKKNRSQLTHRIHCDLIWFGSSLEMGKCSIMSDQFVFFYLLVSTYISILVLVLWSVRFNCWFTYSVFWFKEMHCTKLFAPINFFIRCLTHSAARVHIPSFHIDFTHLLLF